MSKSVSQTIPNDMTCHIRKTPATMLADLFGHNKKIKKLCRKSHYNGIIWCKKLARRASYILGPKFAPLLALGHADLQISTVPIWGAQFQKRILY